MTDAPGKRGAVRLTSTQRALSAGMGLLLLGCVATVFALHPCLGVALPDLLLAVLAVMGVVGIFLAIVGRLPSGFQFAGMSLDFREDELANFLGTLKAATIEDPDRRAELLRMLKQAVGSKEYDRAMSDLLSEAAKDTGDGLAPRAARLGEDTRKPEDSSERTEDSLDSEGRLEAGLEALADERKVSHNEWIKNTGVGKPPRYRYVFDWQGKRIAAQPADYWNPTELDLASRKATRTLQRGTDVDAVLVLSPAEGVAAFTRAFQDVKGAGAVDKLLVENADVPALSAVLGTLTSAS